MKNMGISIRPAFYNFGVIALLTISIYKLINNLLRKTGLVLHTQKRYIKYLSHCLILYQCSRGNTTMNYGKRIDAYFLIGIRKQEYALVPGTYRLVIKLYQDNGLSLISEVFDIND